MESLVGRRRATCVSRGADAVPGRRQIGVWAVVGVAHATWYAVEAVWMLRRRGTGTTPLVTERQSTIVLIGIHLLADAAAITLARRAPTLRLAPDRATAAAVALPIAGAGLALRWWAVRTLGTHFRATLDIREDQPVIRTGPYHYVRHPSYTGGLLAAAGFAAALNDLPAWLLRTGPTLAATLYRIHVEDTLLSRHLGSDYVRYAATTPRLVPGIW